MNPLQCELTIDYDDLSIEVAKYTDKKYCNLDFIVLICKYTI